MIGVGIKHPAYPETYLVTPSNMTSFQQGVVSVSNIVVAYAGHVAFFGFISEMQQPRDFPKVRENRPLPSSSTISNRNR